MIKPLVILLHIPISFNFHSPCINIQWWDRTPLILSPQHVFINWHHAMKIWPKRMLSQIIFLILNHWGLEMPLLLSHLIFMFLCSYWLLFFLMILNILSKISHDLRNIHTLLLLDHLLVCLLRVLWSILVYCTLRHIFHWLNSTFRLYAGRLWYCCLCRQFDRLFFFWLISIQVLRLSLLRGLKRRQ